MKTAIANMDDIEESETVDITNHETLLETVETIRVEDNRNHPAVELYRDLGEPIMDNLIIKGQNYELLQRYRRPVEGQEDTGKGRASPG